MCKVVVLCVLQILALGGKIVITARVRGNCHKDTAEACSSRLVTSFFRPQVSQSVTQFVVAHNLAFNASNHAINLFPKMFPDSETAKKFCLWVWGNGTTATTRSGRNAEISS